MLRVGHWWLTLIIAIQEAEIRRMQLEVSAGKKFARLHLNQCLGKVLCACHPSYIRKHK
jgi:hypothetical protein